MPRCLLIILFFFNDTATTEIYTLSLHDALPISNGLPWSLPITLRVTDARRVRDTVALEGPDGIADPSGVGHARSEEHTSELQSRLHLVCRLLLEKKDSLVGDGHALTA